MPSQNEIRRYKASSRSLRLRCQPLIGRSTGARGTSIQPGFYNNNGSRSGTGWLQPAGPIFGRFIRHTKRGTKRGRIL